MTDSVGVLIVHGIGVQDKHFADKFIVEAGKRLTNLGIAAGSVEFEPAYWADLLNVREEKLWTRLAAKHDLDWVTVRKFVITVLADAVAYRYLPGQPGDMYRAIHERIRDHLSKLRARLGGQDKPVIVIAHSLGSVIMGNYIWDEQKKAPIGKTDLEKMKTLAGVVTFGSNIPLFTLAFEERDIKCFDFPPAGLPPPLKANARWLNFFDADDVLGYPLKPVSPDYAAKVKQDIEIHVGGLFTSWNPVSHVEYWEDDDFLEPVSALIRDVVKA